MKINKEKKERLGPVTQKALLLLLGGATLSLSNRPDKYFSILKNVSKEWQKINERNLRLTIKRLYQSKLIDYTENDDETITLILTTKGRKRILRYDIDKIQIKQPNQWDHLWRLVIFDIPEKIKRGRSTLVSKLKELGFYPLQKSVFIHPYECKDEIDFLVEFFDLTPYVRFLHVKDIDIELDLKRHFDLL